MATVKIKFRPSSVDGRKGTIYYQVIHKRVTRQIRTLYKLFPDEWSKQHSRIVITLCNEERRKHLLLLDKKITEDVNRLEKIIQYLGRKKSIFTADDVISAFRGGNDELSFFAFMLEVIKGLKQQGKIRLVETYSSAFNSFVRFMDKKDVSLRNMDFDLMIAYETWLKSNGLCMNTVSCYMRILRATYNRAVDRGLTDQHFPFKYVYTGVDRTRKRAVSLRVIKRLKSLDLSLDPARDYARDMLLFSFYTRGMSLVDMAFLRKKDLSNGILSYRRKKTGQQLFIKWEPCMQEIVDRYSLPESPYLLSVIDRPGDDERRQCINASHFVNRHLKALGKELGLSIPLTHYVARHSWANAARNRNIPIAVISESMGHDSEATTRIYLTSLDAATIDKANRLILKSLLDV